MRISKAVGECLWICYWQVTVTFCNLRYWVSKQMIQLDVLSGLLVYNVITYLLFSITSSTAECGQKAILFSRGNFYAGKNFIRFRFYISFPVVEPTKASHTGWWCPVLYHIRAWLGVSDTICETFTSPFSGLRKCGTGSHELSVSNSQKKSSRHITIPCHLAKFETSTPGNASKDSTVSVFNWLDDLTFSYESSQTITFAF